MTTAWPSPSVAEVASRPVYCCAEEVLYPDGSDPGRTPVGGSVVSVSEQASTGLSWRSFAVAGADVWTRCGPEQLPWRASRVEFAAVVIDSGDGPKACPVVRTSRPPKGSGPYVDGLVMDPSWTESHRGVTWGRRSLEVTWPPIGGRVAHIIDDPGDGSGAAGRRRAPISNESFDEPSHQRARGGLEAVADVYRYMVRPELSSNRVVVSVVVADGWTVSRLAASIDKPSILLVEGRAVILDGEPNPESG